MVTLKKHLLLFVWTTFSMALFAHNNGHYTFDVEKEYISVNNVTEYFYYWFNLDDNVSFREINRNVDNVAMVHITYQQYYQEFMVDGGVVIVHAQNNIVKAITASVMEKHHQDFSIAEQQLKKATVPDANMVLVPITTEQETFYKKAYLYYDEEQQANIYEEMETGEILRVEPRIFHNMERALAYTRYNGWQKIDTYRKDGYFYLYDTERNIYTYNACKATFSGYAKDYVNESESIASPSSTWSAMLSSVSIRVCDDKWFKGRPGEEPNLYIKVFSSGNKELLRTETQNNQWNPIFSDFNLQVDNGSYFIIYDDEIFDDPGDTIYITDISAGKYFWEKENTLGYFVLEGNPAVDAHWGMQKVFDFYKLFFNQEGYNNNGTNIYQFIDPSAIYDTHNLANAFATYDKDGVGFMCYGLGNDTIDAVVALDVLAHEYTHLVIDFNGNGGLASLGETGALNESFADIMGCAVEHYVLCENANWEIGESIMRTHLNLRSLMDPKSSLDGLKPQPDTYKGDYWMDISEEDNDKGGIHTNSGVQNKWFYLLCEGGDGKNDNGFSYSVNGIGIEKAQMITFANMKHYLTKYATFEDARKGSLLATEHIFGKSFEYQSVQKAWEAVGVGSSISTPHNSYNILGLPAIDTTGTVTGSSSYGIGETALLEAIPNEGFVFMQWNDGNTENPRNIIVSSDTCLYAIFVKEVESSTMDVTKEGINNFIKIVDRSIIINVPCQTNIEIYTTTGKCLLRKEKSQFANINIPQGIYIIKIGTCQQKVFIK